MDTRIQGGFIVDRMDEALIQPALEAATVNRVLLAGAAKLAEHRLIVAGSATAIGQPLYTQFSWNKLLTALLKASEATLTSA